MSRVRESAAVGASSVATLGGFEGLRQVAYPDPATKGYPWTVCYGETRTEDGQPTQPGMRFSLDQCKLRAATRSSWSARSRT